MYISRVGKTWVFGFYWVHFLRKFGVLGFSQVKIRLKKFFSKNLDFFSNFFKIKFKFYKKFDY